MYRLTIKYGDDTPDLVETFQTREAAETARIVCQTFDRILGVEYEYSIEALSGEDILIDETFVA